MNNKTNKDNIIKKKKNQPSKAKNIVKIIFFVNYKILSYIINIVLTLLLIGILTGGICAGALLVYVNNYVDDEIADLALVESESELTTVIYYMEYEDRFEKTNGRWVELDTLHGSENRSWVKYADVPNYLKYAFVALEDKRFYTHNGVDWGRTIRAVQNYVLPSEGGRDFGASTITQQLIKLMTGDDETTIDRKIQEIRRAMVLDAKSSKQDILEAYMNSVFLSHGLYGVQAGANFYFSKDVSELNLIESVAIAAIVQSPTAMNPLRGPNAEGIDSNKRRRDAGLRIMLEEGWITQEEFDEAYDKELVINRSERSHTDINKSYFVDQVINDVQKALMEEFGYTLAMASHRVFSGGLSIYITMDKYIQEVMEHVYSHDEYFPQQPEGAIPYQSAMVLLDPENNNILGIVGGRCSPITGPKVARGLNRASDSRRQPGSSIKPVSVYGPALDVGLIDWGTPLQDTPFTVINGRNWPVNLPAGYEGSISLQRAVSVSKNTTAVHVLEQLTPEYIFKFMHDDLNVTSIVESETDAAGKVFSDIGLAQLALGGLTYGIKPLELTAAFGIFANDGVFTKPRSFTRVLDQRGNVIINNQPERSVILSSENAYIMTRLLQGVVDSGTARSLPMRNSVQVAGKTGTTNSEKDLWFIGYTPYYLCGVWFGYDNPTFINRQGRNPHINLFDYVMNDIHLPIYDNPKTFEQPDTVITAPYCARTGLAPIENGGCDRRMGYYARGLEPAEPCMCQFEDEEDEENEEDEGGEDENEDNEEIEAVDVIEPVTEPPPEITEPPVIPMTTEEDIIPADITDQPAAEPAEEPPPESTESEPEPVTEEAAPGSDDTSYDTGEEE
ncbi:MAG: transglycosylase domain-containing protein [Oscillospiraceae bacterium]|nr:transglycosylase domain-containing protein [Oscillospiraceae bacterium]